MSAAHELLDWYDLHRRTLPWRAGAGETPDPYKVWLSEIMLQQTTVATVKSYFEKFRTLWPTVASLAKAPQEQVLKEWAGLGYYARARNLHKCAGVIIDDFNGSFPQEFNQLLKLPGIGDYTASAIASIAFNQPTIVVDGNVERVVSRMLQIEAPLPAAKPIIKEHTAALQGTKGRARPGDFAQAMMDLGATICTPKSPACGICPWRDRCISRKNATPTDYPRKLPKKKKPVRQGLFFFLIKDSHVLLERRPEKGLLGGMAGLPTTRWEEANSHRENSSSWQEYQPAPTSWEILPDIQRHTFTHFHLDFQVATGTVTEITLQDHQFWHPIDDLTLLPTLFRKGAAYAHGQQMLQA